MIEPARYLLQRRLYLLPLLLLLAVSPARAQREWNIWYFGEYAGVDFNTGLPVALGNGMMRQLEGCASIAHPRTGKLLFYTSGDTVWNALHRPMPNGWKLKSSAPNWTSTQSAIIVPFPRDTNRYYIFTADCGDYWDGSHPTTGISYSIVDMRADNGLGDVVVKNVNIMPKATEKLTFTRHANGRDFWVVTHEFGNQNFRSFLVTPAGVNPTPVISTTGYPHAGDPFNNIGVMKISPNGKKLALAIWYEGVAELLDFNNHTGQVSNPIQLPTEGLEYGICFSPDNTKLYVSRANRLGSAIHQYEISTNSPLLIVSSRIKIADFAPNELGDLQIGPDRKIYVAQGNSVWLGVIHSPNAGGLGCNYQANGVMLAVSSNIRRGSYLGLPNVLLTDPAGIDPQLVPPVARFQPSRQAICAGESVSFTDLSFENPTAWEWFFPGGEPAVSYERHPQNVQYATPGTYQAMLVASSPKGTDTARVQITVNPLPAIDVGSGTREVGICEGGAIQLNVTGGVSFQWSPAEGLSCADCPNPIARPAKTTTYTLTAVNQFGCRANDNITVKVDPTPVAAAGPDQTTCPATSVVLEGSGNGTYQWSPAAGLSCTDCAQPVATPSASTTYQLIVTNAQGCSDTDQVNVTVLPAPSITAEPDTTVCPGTPVQLTTTEGKAYRWSPAAGLSCTDCRQPIATPDTTTTYTVQVTDGAGCPGVGTVTISTSPRPDVDAGRAITICEGDSIRLEPSGASRYQWEPAEGLSCTDCANPLAKPTRTTTYTVTGYGPNGCWGKDTITVTINPAPAIVHAEIGRHFRAYPGTRIDVPIQLNESLDDAGVREIIITLSFQPAMLQLANGGVGLANTLLAGTLLDTWLAIPLDTAEGSYRVRLVAPPGETLRGGAGTLLKLRFQTFLGYPASSELPFTVELVGAGCTRVITSPGFVKLDSVCGLNLRLITVGVDDYALDQNRPNPFNPTTDIPFSLGLDGPTEVTIHDANGRLVATLVNQHLQPGKYQVTWDATGFPSGLYYYRLASGHWSKVQMMLLVK
ncbi:MAG: PKD domain-containing protein [Armatimonadetes bacterium]|nr:PKD domain-containing protein [Armatimonadota bacterium]